jgi:phosphoribosyl-ATP pyrophosphohydrolase/phosphoribosyl-AMP cyclohydrolase
MLRITGDKVKNMNELKFNEQGLIPAVVQDAKTLQVLMVAWMNAEALAKTQESGETWFWSRSRGELWHKGGTSGHVQRVVEIRYDCDADTLLVSVEPAGPACHTGETSCFYRSLTNHESRITPPFSLQSLYAIIASRKSASPETSYTASLFAKGEAKISQKVGEEATEVIVAALAQSRARLVEESADLFYHTLVLLAAKGISLDEVVGQLAARHKPSPLIHE